jgi:hypothetical protein
MHAVVARSQEAVPQGNIPLRDGQTTSAIDVGPSITAAPSPAAPLSAAPSADAAGASVAAAPSAATSGDALGSHAVVDPNAATAQLRPSHRWRPERWARSRRGLFGAVVAHSAPQNGQLGSDRFT